MSVYFTSDLHLGHENSIKFNNRPFENIEEMNTMLIKNINEIVGEKDELWVLGDFAYRINKEEVRALRKQIKCRHVHLIYGNHDKNYDNCGIFQSCQSYKELKTEYGRIAMFHYPILDWNSKQYGAIHLHGHIHSDGSYNVLNRDNLSTIVFDEGHTPKQDFNQLRMYDVGVDANNFKPVSIDEIAEFFGVEKIKRKDDCNENN